MITAFPLKKGLVNVATPGRKIYGNRIIHCEEDGEITLHWRQDEFTPVAPDTYAMIKGEDRFSPDTEYIEVVSGSFSFGD